MHSRHPRSCVSSLALAVAAGFVAAPADAKPPRPHYANTSAEVDLAIPGATVCMIRPASQRVIANCAGFAPDKIEAQLPPRTEMAALVREGSLAQPRVWLLAALVEPRGGGLQMSIEDAEAYVRGSVSGASESLGRPVSSFGLAPGETHTRLVAGGGLVIRQRFETVATDSAPPTTRFVAASLLGHDNMTSLVVTPVAPLDQDVDAALSSVLARVTIKPPPGPVEWRHQAFWSGYYLARATGPVVVRALAPAVGMMAGVVF